MLFQDKDLAITETSVTPHDGIVAILYSLLPKTTLNTWKLRKTWTQKHYCYLMCNCWRG